MSNVFQYSRRRTIGIMGEISLKRSRSTHTLASAMSFCAKGSINNKNKNFGEDSAIIKTWITPGLCQGSSLIGVADGVGGWRRHGVDPSHFSRGILQETGQLFRQAECDGTAVKITPQDSLTRSFKTLLQNRDRYAGGTTVCFGYFNPMKVSLDLINIGDSGALLFREGKCINRTMADVEGMTPRQLTILPSWMFKFQDVLEPAPEVQTSAITLHWELKENDILIMGTDGFFDNVPMEETSKIIEESLPQSGTIGPKTPQIIADNLLERAYYNSLDPDFASPFALRCLKDPSGLEFWGGKPDDITIVVSLVIGQKDSVTSKL